LSVHIRNFRKADIEDVVGLWNESIEHDFLKAGEYEWYAKNYAVLLSKEALERKMANLNFDLQGSFVACQRSQIVGFGLGVVKTFRDYEDEDLDSLPAYFPALVVYPDFRRREIGKELYDKVINYVRGKGKNEVWVHYYSPINFVTGIIKGTPAFQFLVRMGFQPDWPQLSLKLDFKDFKLRDEILDEKRRLEKEGIEFKYYAAKHRDSFSKFMEKNFKGWWFRSLRPNLMRTEPLPFLIATYKSEVVGFVAYVQVGKDGRTGMSPGVSPEFRGRGIGKVLINLWAHEVEKRGAKESIIMTGSANKVAQHIYFELGYKQLGEIWTKWTRISN